MKAAKKRKPSDVMKLYRAVAEYVETRGGKVIVAGGIQCQRWPGDTKFKFTIGVKCVGHAPDYDGEASIQRDKQKRRRSAHHEH